MARPAFIAASEQPPADVETQEVGLNVSDVRQPDFVVEIQGTDLADLGYHRLIRSIRVEEREDEMPLAIVDIWNQGGKLADAFLFANRASMKIRTGYVGGDQTLASRGTFYIHTPRFLFNSADGEIIRLVGMGESVLLYQQGEKRRQFAQVTDAQIAAQIAEEHRLFLEVDDTGDVFDKVLQANETDMAFLRRRARLYGFQVFVRDEVLHFHAPRFDDSKVILRYRDLNRGSITRAQVDVESLLRGQQFTMSTVDPLTKEVVNETSQQLPDEITRRIESLEGELARDWQDIVNVRGAAPQSFIVHEGHRRSVAEAKRMSETFSQANRWVIRNETQTVGISLLKPAQIITVLGLGKFSGRYYVKAADHVLSVRNELQGTGLYGVKLQLLKTGTRELGELLVFQPPGESRGRRRARDDVSSKSAVVQLGERDVFGNFEIEDAGDFDFSTAEEF